MSVLVDTNVLVYTHDPRDREKKRRALEVLDGLIPAELAVLSVQCLTEFYRSVRWRIAEPLSHTAALIEVDRFSRSCRVLDLTGAVVLDGCRGCEAYQMHFWDALIWATAKLNRITHVLTEDFSDGALVEGVRFLDPFAESFDLDSLLT